MLSGSVIDPPRERFFTSWASTASAEHPGYSHRSPRSSMSCRLTFARIRFSAARLFDCCFSGVLFI